MKIQNRKSTRIAILASAMTAIVDDARRGFANKTRQPTYYRGSLLLALILLIIAASTRLQADTGTCGGASITLPFTDVASSNTFFCSIAGAYFSGLTNGTSPTTYSPSASVTREQMAAFVTRTQDSALRRGSLRAALSQWAPTFSSGGMTTVGTNPRLVQCDGADLWVASSPDDTVSRVRASDGKVLETWTGADSAYGILVARGRIFVTGNLSPNGKLYRIDPKLPPGDVVTVTSMLGSDPRALTTDGDFIWTANLDGAVSKVDPGTGDVSTFTAGFSAPYGILFDGTSIWVTDSFAGALLKLNSNGSVAQSVTVGAEPLFPIFDGTNIWVPNSSANSVTVVRASTGTVVATLTGNGLDGPVSAAFDGQRILVVNFSGDSISLWKSADLTPLGSFSTGTNTQPLGACSDGINFWVTLQLTKKLARF